jgi:N-sulfoglucosamine sulfohydrolase
MNPANKNSVWSSWLEKASTNERDHFIVDRMVNRPPVEFYDLHNDPAELKNLATEPRYRQAINQYTAQLKAWMHQQKDAGKDVDIDYHKR